MCIGGFRKPYIEQVFGVEWGVKDLIGGAEERAAIHLVMSMWSRKRGDEKSFKGHMVRRRCGERSFGDHVKGKEVMRKL
jgi:hypothetical protein